VIELIENEYCLSLLLGNAVIDVNCVRMRTERMAIVLSRDLFGTPVLIVKLADEFLDVCGCGNVLR
jgi:hypothetical protein